VPVGVVGNLSTNFGVSRTFRSQHISQRLSDALRDFATLTFDLVDDAGLRAASVHQV